jgi:HK97 family phage portal protein
VSLFNKRLFGIGAAADLIPARPMSSRAGTVNITNDSALRHSAVWACLRLRANLISTLPVDVFRRVNGVQIESFKPPVLVNPGGERVGILEWLYSTQVDLDRAGNTVGLITERDGRDKPSRIDLVPISDVAVVVRKGRLYGYRIAGTLHTDLQNIWHERQYTVAGMPVGLSPVAHAAWSIGEYLSIQQFALDWFGNGTIPAAMLRNRARTLTAEQAADVKAKFKAAVDGRDMFVTGSDWEYEPIQAQAAGAEWIAAKQFGVGDIARFFDCPGDLIDAMVSGQAVTYANIGQRNLQLLIMHLGPAVVRREAALTSLTTQPTYVKLNTDALLRMDPATRAATMQTQILSRTLAPSEARELDNRPPFTESQLAEFDRLFGARAVPATATTGATP